VDSDPFAGSRCRRVNLARRRGVSLMPPAITAPLHTRVGPGIDVAACGERGAIHFSPTVKGISCAGCAKKREGRKTNGRAKLEASARRAHFQKYVPGALWIG
jgi:hypothetical protein